MVFQYVHDPQATELERKLEETRKSNDANYIESSINQCLESPKQPLSQEIKPSEVMIKAYKERQVKQKEEEAHESFLNSIDEQGHKLKKVYLTEGFIATHDPLGLFSSKGNYEKLAWKVFRDVDDSQHYLKTLYFPKLRTDDYNTLISYFEREQRNSKLYSMRNLLLGLAGSGALYYGVHSTLKMKTTILLSAASFYGLYSIFNCFSVKGMNNRLNRKSQEIAKNYPEIKLTNVEFGRINI